MGEWVLEEVCHRLASWRQQLGSSAESLFVSVNLSPVQLSQPSVVERIADVLSKTGLPGERLKLEVTESAVMANPTEAQGKLAAISRLGVKLCLDDFGTGYSSLSRLHAFPFSVLKIDRSFIACLPAGKEHSEVVRTILMLGHTLRLTVVAEGVETVAQRDWLRAAGGCDFAQGYFFSHPIEEDAATAILCADRKPRRLTLVEGSP